MDKKQYRNTLEGKAHCIYANSRYADKKKGFAEPNITVEQIMELIQKPCNWCGQTDWSKNGIDRIDTSIGHNVDNVVCSCWDCNHKRGIKGLMRPVKEYTLNGKFVRRYENSYEVKEIRGVSNVFEMCNMKNNRISSCGSLWCYEGEEETIPKKVEAYKKRKHQKTKIRQYTLDGELVAEYSSMSEAEKITGISHGGISQCCNGLKETFSNYKWTKVI